MPLDPFAQKLVLDWLCGGAAATQPSARWVSFATASPTSQSAFDGPFTTRGSLIMAAANSPQGSVTNITSSSPLVTCTAAATAVGFNLWDAGAGGNRLLWGTCTAAIGCKSADAITLSNGLLKITLA